MTVISVQYRDNLLRFCVYWQAPYDFNLYKNSFAVFPIPGDQATTSQEVVKTYKSFIDYSNINKIDETFVGISTKERIGKR